jgi:hypothetical protein
LADHDESGVIDGSGRDLVGGSGDCRQQIERRIGSIPSVQINAGHSGPGSSAATSRVLADEDPRSWGTEHVPVRERSDSHRG